MRQMKITVTSILIILIINIQGYTQITNVWANNGEDKVTQDELRAYKGKNVINSVWDGDTIRLFGARNEVVDFNLILEAAVSKANKVNVELHNLISSDKSEINYSYANGDALFAWNNRQIELFYVRYLEIKGLSELSYENYYDERHVPIRLRRPYDALTGEANDGTNWYNRPDHNKMYPDIAIPIELHPDFTISAGSNQSIWVDIYIPKTASNSDYRGHVLITENGTTTFDIPIVLSVVNFELPDVPTSKTMLYLGYEDVCKRYTGIEYPEEGSKEEQLCKLVRQRHIEIAHRHKISVIDANETADGSVDQPADYWLPVLNGELFTSANGYDGPGVNCGNGVFSIGTYGSWDWDGNDASAVHQHTDNWVKWFTNNSPQTSFFLYLIDEPDEDSYEEINSWLSILKNNPGQGSKLPIFMTTDLVTTQKYFPDIDISGTGFGFGITKEWDQAVLNVKNDPSKKFFFYNGFRPTQGTFSTEDDGVALRVIPWAQYKKKIDRWFYWESTYYNNFQGGTGQTDVFKQAHTFGGDDGFDDIDGETGDNYNNGDGVLFYPGTDKVFPASSYDIAGPFVSLRMKHWRRGIQDADYLNLASAIDASATDNIVNHLIPKVLWEFGVADEEDPTWLKTDISWSTNPDDWEAARKQLAQIINNHSNNGVHQLSDQRDLQFTVYPNPANSFITISVSCQKGKPDVVKIVDLMGKERYSDKMTTSIKEINISGLSDGIYFIELQKDGKKSFKKLMVNH
jgi:hypothetical protein